MKPKSTAGIRRDPFLAITASHLQTTLISGKLITSAWQKHQSDENILVYGDPCAMRNYIKEQLANINLKIISYCSGSQTFFVGGALLKLIESHGALSKLMSDAKIGKFQVLSNSCV